MILCFGTFARVLSGCREKISATKFVARIAWTVDQMNSCLEAGLDYEISDKDLETIKSLGNAPVVSKLLSCNQDFELKSNKRPLIEDTRKRFESKVMPFISEDMVANAVLALRDIISRDDTIDTLEGTRKETFKKYLGLYRDEFLQQTSFNVPDLFARILLYTTCINNREGEPYIGMITDKFIQDSTSTVWAKLKWDTNTQTLDLLPSEEERFFDEVNALNELRLSLMKEQENSGWLGVSESILFPSRHRNIEVRDPEIKRRMSDKLMQYMKLVHEFADSLAAEQQSTANQAMRWSVFPSERTRSIRQQLTTLSNELFALGVFSDRLSPESNSGSPSKCS